MRKINFKLLKDNNIIIDKENLNCISNNEKITFVIDDAKYNYLENILEKITTEDKIQLDFKEEKCKVYIKNYKDPLILNLKIIENKTQDNKKIIKYNIETEENTINTIVIEYI